MILVAKLFEFLMVLRGDKNDNFSNNKIFGNPLYNILFYNTFWC